MTKWSLRCIIESIDTFGGMRGTVAPVMRCLADIFSISVDSSLLNIFSTVIRYTSGAAAVLKQGKSALHLESHLRLGGIM